MHKNYHTKTGQLIEEYIRNNAEHSFSAAELHNYFEEQGISINMVTIYRNLDKLTENSLLIKYKSASSDAYLYQYAGNEGGCHKHLHMQCKECNKVIHVENEAAEKLVNQLSDEYGFNIEFSSSSLSGVCRDCKNRQAENKKL